MNELVPITKLPQAARRAVVMAEALIGKMPLVYATDHLPHRAATGRTWFPPDPRTPVEISYLKKDPYTEHAIVHEAGHIIRLAKARPEERKKVNVNFRNIEQVVKQVGSEYEAYLERTKDVVVSTEALFDRLNLVVTLIANNPVDMRIEQWIFEEFPELRPQQHDRILEAYGDISSERISQDVEKMVFKTFVKAAMSMGAARAHHNSKMFDEPQIFQAYEGSGYGDIGRRLYDLVFSQPDKGHLSDGTAIIGWARELNMVDWFEWVPMYETKNSSINFLG